MSKRILGRTGLIVNEIGFGGIPMQRVNQETANLLISEAVSRGVNFFDNARGYSNSEELMGNALRPYRKNVIIATKTMVRDYSGMKEELETSLKNFHTDHIDLYQFHFVNSMEQVDQLLGDSGAYKALIEAKEAGKVGHIGITCHSADLLEKVLTFDVFDTIQFPYNLIERQGEKVFKTAREMNVGVIAMKPMAGGALEQGELSLRFILENPNVSVAIAGMQSVDEVVRNTAVMGQPPLNSEEKAEVERLRETLGTDFCRRCGYCMPCPQGINIPSVFLFEGYLTRYDLSAWAKERYSLMTKFASDCVECGICEPRCPYGLNIREKMKKAADLFGK